MTCSLILCTLNRVEEVADFFQSLVIQTFKDFECIVVDQNEDDRLDSIIKEYSDKITIKHIKSIKKGLSLNRNLGLIYALGSIVAFPDDDCEYLSITLEQVVSFFSHNERYRLFTINTVSKTSNIWYNSQRSKVQLNNRNYYRYAISMGIFVRYRSLSDLSFDEQLGVGCYFGAGEESDFVSNLLTLGYDGIYDGSMFVYHPSEVPVVALKDRYIKYSLGYGALMKKEIIYRHKYYMLVKLIFDLLGRIVAACLPIEKRKLYWYSFKYRLLGYIKYTIKK